MSSVGQNRITVKRPGPMTLVQDRGRVGFQQLGVSVSGAVDFDALDIGNRIVGNDSSLAGLEVMLGGLAIEFEQSTVFALTGADTSATLDGVPVPTNVSCLAHPGAELELAMVTNGLRAYLTVAGGVSIPETLGSRSTHVASELGGIEGRSLAEGDSLVIGMPSSATASGILLDDSEPSVPHNELAIRVVLGPQDNEFSAAGVETLLASTYTVTDQSNRQGLRLDGPEIESRSGRYDIISDAVVNGSVQIPGDGKPIILLADRQTTGGYAKIATVATADLSKLGQAAPGTTIKFAAVSIEESQQLLMERQRRIYEADLIKVVEPNTFSIDGLDVAAGVAENGDVKLAEINGNIYPLSAEEYTPAN